MENNKNILEAMLLLANTLTYSQSYKEDLINELSHMLSMELENLENLGHI